MLIGREKFCCALIGYRLLEPPLLLTSSKKPLCPLMRARHPEFLKNPETLNLVIDFAPNKDGEALILDKLELDMLPV